jgi:hypothetical protein
VPKRLVDLRDQHPLLDIVSYGRRAPENGRTFAPAERDYIARTANGAPEVMIKVSGGGQSTGGVAAHFRYIDRRGELEIETDEGERLSGKGAEQVLLEDWGLATDERESRSPYSGTPGRRPVKLVHNIVFSMPVGTPPEKLLAAVKNFAEEKFALEHRYAMVLHTDHDHPHVHLVLKAVNERGERLNIRKAILRAWRRDFADALRKQGVAANATERAVRGVTRNSNKDGIYRAMRRGDSTFFAERAYSVAHALRDGHLFADAGSVKVLTTRRHVERGWRQVEGLLERDGDRDLAQRVRRFVDQMPPPRTERQWIAAELAQHAGRSHLRQGPIAR